MQHAKWKWTRSEVFRPQYLRQLPKDIECRSTQPNLSIISCKHKSYRGYVCRSNEGAESASNSYTRCMCNLHRRYTCESNNSCRGYICKIKENVASASWRLTLTGGVSVRTIKMLSQLGGLGPVERLFIKNDLFVVDV